MKIKRVDRLRAKSFPINAAVAILVQRSAAALHRAVVPVLDARDSTRPGNEANCFSPLFDC